MQTLQEVLDKLKELGFTEEKIHETLELLLPDLEEALFDDFALKAKDGSQVEGYAKKLAGAESPEKYDDVILEMAKEAYGEEGVSAQIDSYLVEALSKVVAMTEKAKDIHTKYQSGDPATVKMVDEQANTPEGKALAEELKAQAQAAA